MHHRTNHIILWGNSRLVMLPSISSWGAIKPHINRFPIMVIWKSCSVKCNTTDPVMYIFVTHILPYTLTELNFRMKVGSWKRCDLFEIEGNWVTTSFILAVGKTLNIDFCINLVNVIKIHGKHKPDWFWKWKQGKNYITNNLKWNICFYLSH